MLPKLCFSSTKQTSFSLLPHVLLWHCFSQQIKKALRAKFKRPYNNNIFHV